MEHLKFILMCANIVKHENAFLFEQTKQQHFILTL